MQYLLLLFFLFLSTSQAKYLDNHSCSECHEEIYEEYQSSMHSKGYFNDILHRKIADKVSTKKYDCASCHMPTASNLKALISGESRPDKNNKTHTDAVSCYFCHTIAYVKKAHQFNINIKARQAKNYKPTLYGRLVDPDDSDKHSSASNPVYAKKVCMGCHSHKLNDNNTTIFRAMSEKQNSLSCIKCHMPKIDGDNEEMDKKARGHHASHKFLGIHDKAFRQKGVDINISIENKELMVTLTNKMGHPLIIQPSRAKFLKIELKRAQKVIWKNYLKEPSEDKQGYFAYSFKQNGMYIVIPAAATKSSVHNLNAKETKELIYTLPSVEKGDEVTVSLYVQLAKSDCVKVIKLEDENLTKSSLIKKVSLKL